MFLMGFQVIENVHMTHTVPVRTHRKKRINKKWRKRYGFKSTPSKQIIRAGNVIYGHPITIRTLKAKLRETPVTGFVR
jgi:ribosomal protein L32E